MHTQTNEYDIKTFDGVRYWPSDYTKKKMVGQICEQ